jgi:dTDP-4-dehydrorhamnose reductase
MKILITGTGQFATNWAFNKSEYENINIGRTQRLNYPNKTYKVNLNNFEELKESIESIKPDFIINAAAITDVEYCETNIDLAIAINTNVPRNLSIIAGKLKIPFVQLSTDNFSNSNDEIRNELVNPIPVNIYGETKIKAEEAIMRSTENFLIIRTNFFGYAPLYSKTSLMKIIDDFNNNIAYKGAVDLLFNPASIDFVIESIDTLVKNEVRGVVNISSDNCISKYDFAKFFLERLNYSKEYLCKTRIDLMSSLAKRPQIMCLENTKIKSLLGIKHIDFNDQIELFYENLKFKEPQMSSIK